MKNKPHIFENPHEQVVPDNVYYKHSHHDDDKNVAKALIFLSIAVVLVSTIYAFKLIPTAKIEDFVYELYPDSGDIIGDKVEYSEVQDLVENMTVSKAYDLLNGKRMELRTTESIPWDEEQYLRDIFKLTDKGIIERAKILVWHENYSEEFEPDYQHDELILQLKSMQAPPRLWEFHTLLTDGMIYQKQFFDEWHDDPEKPFNIRDKILLKSHDNIYAAYNYLLSLYSPDKYTQNVFFQNLYTLCLD